MFKLHEQKKNCFEEQAQFAFGSASSISSRCYIEFYAKNPFRIMLFIPGKPSVEQASIRMVSSVILVHWCNDVLVLPYLWSMDVIGHKYESAYHLY